MITYSFLFSSTNIGQDDYLPSDRNILHNTEELGTTLLYIANTPQIIDDVTQWWVLCSSTPDCLSPQGAQRFCPFRNDSLRFGDDIVCHRYDQAIVNVLLLNRKLKTGMNYTIEHECVSVARYPTQMYTLRYKSTLPDVET